MRKVYHIWCGNLHLTNIHPPRRGLHSLRPASLNHERLTGIANVQGRGGVMNEGPYESGGTLGERDVCDKIANDEEEDKNEDAKRHEQGQAQTA
jgi:hypothetical protein